MSGGAADDEDTIDDPAELLERVRRAREQRRDGASGLGADSAGPGDDLTVAGRAAHHDDESTVAGRRRSAGDAHRSGGLDDETTVAPDPEMLRRLRSSSGGLTAPVPLDDDATVMRGAKPP